MDFGLALILHRLGMDWEEGFKEDRKAPYVRKSKRVSSPMRLWTLLLLQEWKDARSGSQKGGASIEASQKVPRQTNILGKKKPAL
jgi:hypothetical protein